MKKIIVLIMLCIYSFGAIHAENTWNLSSNGTLTISGTDMYWYPDIPWFSKRDKIKKVIIENGVINIGEESFSGCSNLTSVTIPNSVTSIERSAFKDCVNLTSVTIPESVTSIGEKAFYGCESLATLTIPNSVTFIGGEAFSGTKWSANLPKGLLYIGHVLYQYRGTMPSNTKIDIKEGTTCISGYAFLQVVPVSHQSLFQIQ